MLTKKIFLFYLLLIIPLGCLILSAKYDYINSGTFVLLLIIYLFIYRPLICGIRLVQNKKIGKQDFWKNFIPFWNDKYWSFLFFNK